VSATELSRDDAEPPSTGSDTDIYIPPLAGHVTVSVTIDEALDASAVPANDKLHTWVAQTLSIVSITQPNQCAISSTPPSRAADIATIDTAVHYEVAVSVVGEKAIQSLNAEYRHKDKPTNVLSFPSGMPLLPANNEQPALAVLGDIVLCLPVIEAESEAQQKLTEHHWAHMIVHSVLHLVGHDHVHSDAADVMEALEVRVLHALSMPDPFQLPLQAS